MKKILAMIMALGLGVVALCGMTACGEETSKSKLKIGYTVYAPMNYEENGKLVGFDTEFAEKVCAEIGLIPEFIVIDWNNKVSELNTKKIDCIWNGMTITEELKEAMAISEAYMENKQVVVIRTEDAAKYTDLATLAQATSVAVESGSAGQSVAEDNNFTDKLNKMTAQSDCLLEVKTKRSDIAILDITMAKAMTGAGTDYSDLTYIDVGFAGEEYGIGFRKEDVALLNQVNVLIAMYKVDGTFDDLVKKYMA